MCDDVFDDEDAGDLMDIKMKEFERINSGIEQTAFRDAFLESKETHVQRGFEDGFKESYQNHSSVNLVKGFVTVLLSSGIIDSSPVVPTLMQLKEDLDQLEERLVSVHDLFMTESESKGDDKEAEMNESSHSENQGTRRGDDKEAEMNESSHSENQGTGSEGQSDLRTELKRSFSGVKERLKSVCDAIQIPLSKDVLNCEISFDLGKVTSKESVGKVTSRSITSTQTDAEDGRNS